MQLLRLCTSLCRQRLTLLEWLNAVGPRASTTLLSCVMCVVVPDEATIVAAVCSSLASAWLLMPDGVDDGGMLELLAHVNLVAGLAWSLFTGRPACEGWAASAPAVRCLLVLVFGFAALARLNSDYHDVRRSSSTALALQLADALGASLGLSEQAVDSLGDRRITLCLRALLLGLETLGLAVPVLLWCGATSLGLACAWALALALGCGTAAFDMSCLLVASLPFWVPPHRVLALRWMTVAPAARFCGLLAATMLLGPALLQQSSHVRWRLRLATLIWMVAANPLQYTAVSLPDIAACDTVPGAAGLAGVLPQVGVLTLILAMLNGACPYLGLKTQATWSMFSNLHVEGGVSNHLLIPASLQPFGYAHDCVTVVKTNVPALQEQHAMAGGVARLRLFRSYVERTGTEAALSLAGGLWGERAALPYDVPYFQLRRVIAVHALPLLQEFFVEYVRRPPLRGARRRGAPRR